MGILPAWILGLVLSWITALAVSVALAPFIADEVNRLIAVTLVATVVGVFVAPQVAAKKGRSAGWWTLGGLLFGFWATYAALLIGRLDDAEGRGRGR